MTRILALVLVVAGTGAFLYSQGYLGGGGQVMTEPAAEPTAAPAAEPTTEPAAETTTDGS